MSLKKIWIAAGVLGLITTVLLYITVFSSPSKSVSTVQEEEKIAKAVAAEKEEEQETEEIDKELPTEEEQNKANYMLPIAEGKRAMSVEVSVVQGVSGFIKPGSFVDLVSTMIPPEDSEQHPAATILLQNVKVLSIGHSADTRGEAARYATVTLEVAPKEGLALGFAKKDQLSLMLRNEGDGSLEKEHTHVHEDDLHEGVFK